MTNLFQEKDFVQILEKFKVYLQIFLHFIEDVSFKRINHLEMEFDMGQLEECQKFADCSKMDTGNKPRMLILKN